MKLTLLRIWFLASGIIMISILIIAMACFESIYFKAVYKPEIDDSKTKIILTKKVDKNTKTPMELGFPGGQVTIEELKIGNSVYINVEGESVTYSPNGKSPKPIIFFREDLTEKTTNRFGTVRTFRRYFVTIVSAGSDTNGLVYELSVGFVDQKETEYITNKRRDYEFS